MFDALYFHFQLCITTSQMQWTADVTKALASTKERGDKKALKSLKRKQVGNTTLTYPTLSFLLKLYPY